jgi:hypothetical protein
VARVVTMLALAGIGVGAGLLSAAPARSVTVTTKVPVIADAYVDSANATTNYGAATQLQQRSPGTSTIISFLTFQVSGLPGPPVSATLNLMSRSSGTTPTQVFAVPGSWTETSITWSAQPTIGSLIATTGALTQNAPETADVTSAITGDGIYSFALKNKATAIRYDDSKEGTTPPTLDISYDTTTSTTSDTSTASTASTTDTTASSSTVSSSSSSSASSSSTTTTSTTPTTSSATTTTSTTTTPTTSSATTTTSTTTSAAPDPVVMAAGDIACAVNDPNFNNLNGQPGYCHMRATAGLTSTVNPTAILVLGDEQYNSGSSSDFTASYAQSWGSLRSITKPSVGNHEYGSSGAGGYFKYFGTAATGGGAACSSGCGGYYSFNLGNWHLVAINTECTRIDGGAGCATGSPQEKWLKADLAAHPNACTLVFGHRPRWSSNSFASPDIAPLVADMYAAKVDIYLSGHSHSYERFKPQNASGAAATDGITQLVVGTGGSFYTGFGTTVPNSAVHKSNIFGVLKLTLHPTGWDSAFVADSSTPWNDTAPGTCH